MYKFQTPTEKESTMKAPCRWLGKDLTLITSVC